MLNAATTSVPSNHAPLSEGAADFAEAPADNCHVLFIFSMGCFWQLDARGAPHPVGCQGVTVNDWEFDLSIDTDRGVSRGNVICLSPYRDHARQTLHLTENQELVLDSRTGKALVRS